MNFLDKFFNLLGYFLHYLILASSLLVLSFSAWFFYTHLFSMNELITLFEMAYLLIFSLFSVSFILHHYIMYTNKDIDMEVAMEKLTPKKALSIIKGKREDIPMYRHASQDYLCYGAFYAFGKCKKAQSHKENLDSIPKETQKVFVIFYFIFHISWLSFFIIFLLSMLAPKKARIIETTSKTNVTPKEAKEIFCKNVLEKPSYSGFKKGTIYYSTDKKYYIFTTATDNSKDIVKIGKDFPSTSMSHTVGGSTYIQNKDNIFSCNKAVIITQ